MKKYILNGKIDHVPTNDDNWQAIGIVQEREIKTFDGEVETIKDFSVALTQALADEIGWIGCYANIRFFINEIPINPETVEEEFIRQFYGDVSATYLHRYSEITGYLWTDEEFKVGGHDIRQILEGNKGKYIHLEIELLAEKDFIVRFPEKFKQIKADQEAAYKARFAKPEKKPKKKPTKKPRSKRKKTKKKKN